MRAQICEKHRKLEKCVVCGNDGTYPAQLCSNCSDKQNRCCVCDSEYARYPATVCDKHKNVCVRCGRDLDGGCFITSACIVARGLPDDCQELITFRNFRDKYVKKLPNGDQIIREYYEFAPKIVAEINRAEDNRAIYSELYERLVLKTVELVKLGKEEEALMNCLRIFNELKQKYLQED